MKEMNQKMGTHKFRFSDIMPHSLLYKLKGMSRSNRKLIPSSPKNLSSSDTSSLRKLRDTFRLSSSSVHPQASSPSKSSFKRKIKRKTIYKPSSRLKLYSSSLHSHRFKASSSANAISDSAVESSSSDRVFSLSDQTYGVSRDPQGIKYDRYVRTLEVISEEPSISGNLSPSPVDTVKESPFEMKTKQKLKKPNVRSPGIKIRANSPKIVRKKTTRRLSPESKKKKKETAENYAIVLSSVDPERDFRESMVEMIMENKIKEQKDLEDLLACYLSLNSSEYHGVIIKAFEKTWLHLTHLT